MDAIVCVTCQRCGTVLRADVEEAETAVAWAAVATTLGRAFARHECGEDRVIGDG